MATPAAAHAATSPAPAAALVPETEYDVGLNRDGEKVKDPSYYRLLGVLAAASDAELKKAYRKQSLRWHPDAQAKFQEISEAYTILSDSNSRAVYDKHGKQSAMGEAGGEDVMPDPGQLFSQMFGGKAFEDWIGEISLGKEVSKAFVTLHSEAHVEPTPTPAAAAAAPGVSPTGTAASATSAPAASASAPLGAESGATASAASSTHGSTSHTHGHAHGHETGTPKSHLAGKPPKLSAEQKQKVYEEEKKSWEEKRQRIETLAQKLRDRVRPFVEASKPGDKDDPETKRFAERMRDEARDLAMESFGVELCHLLGEVYMAKATTYIRLHRKPSANLLGLPGWWSRVKEKGTTLKEGWSFLSTGLDVQRAMVDMEKRQERGDLGEEEMRQLEQELSGTLLLVAWKGSKFELGAVLRQVVDLALSKESPSVTDAMLMNRAKAILFIGAILKAVQPEEGDDERRELERLVAEANARRKEKKHKKDKEHAAAASAKDKKVHAAAAAAGGGPSATAAAGAGSTTPDVKA
ncbi:DnaJ-domain-containing protein [Rhodotorula sp. JG-1b]|nr:DnaJ-domain-containing protein [Rhodotorula sp. JG-1b]